jgi:methylenetetrahydrofolate dehydrogenase (NADP+)/methenyltetrahydrofolate cyclohydrolase
MLLDGKATSQKIKEQIKDEVLNIKHIYNQVPHLVIVQIGDNQASNVYIKNKLKAAEFVGIKATHIHFNENIQNEELITKIRELNSDNDVDGIIVQLPIPKHLNENDIINEIDNTKDVDGFGLINKGKLFCGLESLKSATPYGVMKLLEMYNIDVAGKNAVVIGRSNIVGKPMAMMLLSKNATVTICHSKTQNLKNVCKSADILVVAIGKAKFVTKDMVKDGAVVIDVGMNRDENNKLCGDVDFDNVKDIASYITPVPGGVGPLTISMLLLNTLTAYKTRKGIKC